MANEKSKLTHKQRLFCEFYVVNGGNATQAAISAGYREKNAQQIGAENLLKLVISDYIKALTKPADNKRIATVTDVLEFWSQVMMSDENEMTERLIASDKLGKTLLMFKDRVEHSGTVSLPVQIVVEGI